MSRNRLHITKLEEFAEWLASQGWERQEPKGEWEVLRMHLHGEYIIVHTRKHATEHLTLHGNGELWFSHWMRRRKIEESRRAS